MNQYIFFAHILIMLFFLGWAVRMGRFALAALVMLCGVLANLFVTKQADLFTLHVTCSDVFAIGGMLGLNVLQELYGREVAKRVCGAALLALVFFACMAQLHLFYEPNCFDYTQDSFRCILSSSPRIVLASCFVYYVVQRLDIFLFSLLKSVFDAFSVRVFVSLICSQFLDTVLFSFLGLYGVVSSLFDLIVMSFTIKVGVILFSSPLVGFLKRGRDDCSLNKGTPSL